MIRRPPRSTLSSSSAASDVYKRQDLATDVVEAGRQGVGQRLAGPLRVVGELGVVHRRRHRGHDLVDRLGQSPQRLLHRLAVTMAGATAGSGSAAGRLLLVVGSHPPAQRAKPIGDLVPGPVSYTHLTLP